MFLLRLTAIAPVGSGDRPGWRNQRSVWVAWTGWLWGRCWLSFWSGFDDWQVSQSPGPTDPHLQRSAITQIRIGRLRHSQMMRSVIQEASTSKYWLQICTSSIVQSSWAVPWLFQANTCHLAAGCSRWCRVPRFLRRLGLAFRPMPSRKSHRSSRRWPSSRSSPYPSKPIWLYESA